MSACVIARAASCKKHAKQCKQEEQEPGCDGEQPMRYVIHQCHPAPTSIPQTMKPTPRTKHYRQKRDTGRDRRERSFQRSEYNNENPTLPDRFSPGRSAARPRLNIPMFSQRECRSNRRLPAQMVTAHRVSSFFAVHDRSFGDLRAREFGIRRYARCVHRRDGSPRFAITSGGSATGSARGRFALLVEGGIRRRHLCQAIRRSTDGDADHRRVRSDLHLPSRWPASTE